LSETKTKDEEKKAEQPKPATKHKLPEGLLTPVEATHKLKKEVNPHTGEPYAPSTLNSQLVYTKLKGAKTNKMPVRHFDAEGNAFDEPQVSEHGVVLTRPGFDWDELAEWWHEQPARGQRAPKEEGEKTEAKHRAPVEESEDADDEDDDLEDEEDDDLEEAE
jgi:hypothetical protein